MEEILKRKENENLVNYWERVTLNKKSYDIDFSEWGTAILEEDNNYSSENLRKDFYFVEKMFKRLATEKENQIVEIASKEDNTDLILELEMKKAELKEERKRINLIRGEITKAITEKVKYENLVEIFSKVINESKLPKFENNKSDIFIKSENEMIACIADPHYGMDIKNDFETYNSNVFVERLYNYYDKIIKIKKTHGVNVCHVPLLGDLISGIIHNVIRIENSENMIEQIQGVSEVLSDFFYKLSFEFDKLNIYFVTGNHSRNIQNKKEELIGERLENLILWYLKARLKEVKNIEFCESLADNTIVKTKICEKNCIFTHGDNDTAPNVVARMTNMFEEKVDLVLLAHRHNFNVLKQGKSLVVTSGAFLSLDEYCVNNSLAGEPSQTVIILNDKEIETIYDVKIK